MIVLLDKLFSMTLAADSVWHGTENGYQNYKCRCDACKLAHADYYRGLRYLKRQFKMCVECGQPSPNGVRCPKHALAHRQRQNARAKMRRDERKGR